MIQENAERQTETMARRDAPTALMALTELTEDDLARVTGGESLSLNWS
jgi:bacteriocin-like protein